MKRFRHHGCLILAALLIASCNSERREFDAAKKTGSSSAYLAFLANHPNGRFAAAARTEGDTLAWAEALKADTAAAFRDYQRNFPSGAHVSEAAMKLTELVPVAATPDWRGEWRSAGTSRVAPGPVGRLQLDSIYPEYPSGTLFEFTIDGKSTTLTNSTLRGGMIDTKEFGPLEVAYVGSSRRLRGTRTQRDQVLKWLGRQK
jgi:hypothetical protein